MEANYSINLLEASVKRREKAVIIESKWQMPKAKLSNSH